MYSNTNERRYARYVPSFYALERYILIHKVKLKTNHQAKKGQETGIMNLIIK